MTSVPPPYPHPGSPPPRPELPEGVTPTPAPPGSFGPPSGSPPPYWQQLQHPDRAALPAFAPWAPFVAMVVAFLAAGLGFVVIAAAVQATGTPVDADDLPTGVTVGGTLVQDLALVVSALLFARLGVERLSPAAFGLRRTAVQTGLLWSLVAFICFYGFAFVWTLALGVDERDDLAKELGADESTLNLVVVGILVTVIAPLSEEFFFRGFFFPALWRWKGWVFGAIVTGIVFGLIHAGGTGAVFLVPLAVFGFLLCLLYRWTGSLLPCLGLHALNNALALGVTLSWEWWQVLLGMTAAPLLVLAIATPLAAPRPASAPG